MKSMQWEKGKLLILDQTLLPREKQYITCTTPEEVAQAICAMKVRGAPAIGVAAAYGLALKAVNYLGEDRKEMDELLQAARDTLAKTRPTAVNLFWALDRMKAVWQFNKEASCAKLTDLLVTEAMAIDAEDLAMNKQIGLYGSELIYDGANILTHCNAGALATAGYGTALGVIRTAFEQGKRIQVYAGETRPLLQGARLTAWELMEENIPVTLIADSMAGYLMQQGKIDMVIVGADRITAQGDVANKIGTYSLAVLAHHHGVPFYVAAPSSTIDLTLTTGEEINIEERAHEEICRIGDICLAPEGVNVYNPAFDVTPAKLVTAIITDRGVNKPPYGQLFARIEEKEFVKEDES